MFIVRWFKGVLESLGLMSKSGKIIFLGLDNAGKTSLLGMLKENKMKQFDPTLQPHSEELSLGNLRFKTWDLGGHKAARKTWRNYFPNVDGIVYLIDAAEPERFKESAEELEAILNTPAIERVPICILGNKIDKKTAVSEETLRHGINLPSGVKTIGKERPVEVFMCSIAKRSGYAQGFKWLGQFLK